MSAAFSGPTWSGGPKTALIATGAFELLLGAGFLVGGLMVESPGRGGLLLTGGILAAVGVLLTAWGLKAGAAFRNAERLKRTGLPGSATITGLTQTGVTVW